jgi:RNA polymerase sigma-70 factor (ECF subfamily)
MSSTPPPADPSAEGRPAPDEASGASPEPAPHVVAALVANHRQFLAFLEKRVGSRTIAEDILQDAFVRGVSKFDTLRADESAVAWFYRLLRNAVVDHHRRRGASQRKLAEFEAELGTLDPGGAVHGAICSCVRELAATLDPKYADALQAVEVAGMPVKDYAARAGISASNAGVRLFRARKALLERVERCCGSCAEHGCLDCTCGSGAGHAPVSAR